MSMPVVKLTKGIHVLHLFYRVDRGRWAGLATQQTDGALKKLEGLCAANAAASNPRLLTYTNVGGKADLVFFLLASELGQIGQMHRDLEACFPPGVLQTVYSFFSITELPDYVTSEEDMKAGLVAEKLQPGSEEFETKLKALKERHAQYEHFRLYPELPDWEVMAFYPMSKRRAGNDNWYSLDFAKRKELMAGHARVGRKFAGRISQLISGATGLDDWEWGVTLMAHQVDALKEIVYEMRFDEVSARYGEFGPFYVNLRLSPADLWQHLKL
jgi:hydrogen peroxide-dependent heme synthase